MNKTVTVNIGGIVFHIDENAYDRFKAYLEAIRGHFTTAEGRDEIMQDIESRIAEMFMGRIKDSKQVITLDDVDEVTKQMGKPEDFGDASEKREEQTSSTSSSASSSTKKRLFRNPDDKMLGGVCSGVAAYFEIDPVWMRLILAVSFFVFGSGFLLYIILWIIIPEAKTTAEKLQMRGEPVTVSNIEKNVKEEMEHLKKRFDEFSKGGGKKAGTVIGRIFEAIGEVFIMIFKIIGKIIAVFFTFIGVIIVIVLFVSVFALMGVPGTHYPHVFHNLFNSGAQFAWTYVGVVLLIGIPFAMLAYAGLRMLFNIKKSSRVLGFTALGLWLIGLCICMSNGIYLSRQFTEKDSVRKEITLAQPSSNFLYLEMNDMKNSQEKYDYDFSSDYDWDMSGDSRVVINGKEYSSGKVKLDILKSPTDSFELTEIFYASGPGRKEAAELASRINYSFTQSDSLITFQRYFTVSKDERYRDQHVQLVLRMPVGSSVHLDKSLKRFLYDVDNIGNIYDKDMVNRTWMMTNKGLKCLDCNGNESTIDGSSYHVTSDDGDEVNIDNGAIRIHSKDGDEINIDKYGVHIDGKNNVAIDKNGVHITEDGKDVLKIDKDGVVIDGKEKKKDK